ncbi:MAG: acyl--CoA ligase [Chitinispirillaceae bacterium]|nr:acyl--CoA ligase [Chitinispirillaceae bacterium]
MINPPLLLHHFLEQSSERCPEKTAVVCNEIRATYKRINNEADCIARALCSHGVEKGNRVALLFENGLEYITSYYGILKAGAVAVPLSSELKEEQCAALIDRIDARAFLFGSKWEAMARNALVRIHGPCVAVVPGPKTAHAFWPSGLHDLHEWQTAGVFKAVNRTIDENDIASIIFTSGSTGTSKGVVLSHRNIVANTLSIIEYLQLTDRDVQMVVLPFFYVMGKSLLNTHIAVGGTVVINNRFAFAAAVLNQMVEEKVTGFSGVPSTYAYLLNRSPLAKYRDKLTTLRYCSQAGGHMPTAVKQELRQALPDHTRIVIMYGATEASARLTWLDPAWFEKKIGSIGKPIPGVKVRVIDEQGNDAAPNQVGELVASGSNIMQGYWKDPDATARVLDKNGYHTGDLGYYDEDGFLFISGRKDSILKVGGHKINPQEIEEAIMADGYAIEVAVVGMDDPILGKKLVAIIVPRDGTCDEKMVLSACSSRLPRYKVPSLVLPVSSLPKTANGKTDRERCSLLVHENENKIMS